MPKKNNMAGKMIREVYGEHPEMPRKQKIAIGLSKARQKGVKTPKIKGKK